MPLFRPMKIGFASTSSRSWGDEWRRGLQERPERLQRAGRQVLHHPAGPDEGMVHPQTRDQLQQVEATFAEPRPLGVDRGRAQFQAHRGDPAQMRGDPVELQHQDPDDLGALGDLVLDAEQPLHRQAVHGLIGERRQVVRPGAERDTLRPGTEFHVLLDAGVQVADGRPYLGDRLALQRQDQPEHAVGARVLRSHVDDEPLAALKVLGLVGRGENLVPVLPGDRVHAAFGGLGIGRSGGCVRGGCLRHA